MNKDFTSYASKAPTALQTHCAEWIVEKTGYQPKDMAEFTKAVQLAVTLYGDYQASPENKARRATETAERAQAKTTAKPPAKPTATAKAPGSNRTRKAPASTTTETTPARSTRRTPKKPATSSAS